MGGRQRTSLFMTEEEAKKLGVEAQPEAEGKQKKGKKESKKE